MIIVYHSRDLDGYTSGAILKKRFPEAHLIGYDYGQPIPVLPSGDNIILVDVSFPISDMIAIAADSKSFTWIDHHITAINEFNERAHAEQMPPQLMAVLQDGVAACELAFNWAFPESEMPYSIKLLGMYDTWRNKDKKFWDEQVLPFQYGMRTMCHSAESFPEAILTAYDTAEVADIVQLGKIILNYQDEQNAIIAKSAFEFLWRGYRVIAINASGFSSLAFKSVYNPDRHQIMMPFKFTGKYWVFSLYTEHDDIDCSLIAKSLGGGGHKKAAGFQVDSVTSPNFPFPV